ncbi:hypothetical protein L210DRAFT_3536204 [Boletus edulis BED1]|uniref:Uncharacterized protein n=1 Tax=Boletus edulis BED1 TaxID=1328754 RepID=A0AAD4BXX0_BOLED|nr:hypothetical protein L210DRAFT_3536204 [Boletus edulis BED1]
MDLNNATRSLGGPLGLHDRMPWSAVRSDNGWILLRFAVRSGGTFWNMVFATETLGITSEPANSGEVSLTRILFCHAARYKRRVSIRRTQERLPCAIECEYFVLSTLLFTQVS